MASSSVCALSFASSSSSQKTEHDEELAFLFQQLEEINQYFSTLKGKNKVDDTPDNELAAQTFRDQVQNLIDNLQGAQLAKSISRALADDDTPLQISVEEERLARRDREMALKSSEDEASIHPYLAISGEEIDQDQFLQTLGGDDYLGIDNYMEKREKSSQGQVLDSQEAAIQYYSKRARCAICWGDLPAGGLIKLPCDQLYCVSCLRNFFTLATMNESLYPPSCCGHRVPLELIKRYLTEDQIEDFKDAGIEFSTTGRIYCSNRICNRFIPLENIQGDVAFCRKCLVGTCVHCRDGEHDGDCPKDAALNSTLDLAAKKGWRRCGSCKAIVELVVGCNHMM
jgi:hypothetical protein